MKNIDYSVNTSKSSKDHTNLVCHILDGKNIDDIPGFTKEILKETSGVKNNVEGILKGDNKIDNIVFNTKKDTLVLIKAGCFINKNHFIENINEIIVFLESNNIEINHIDISNLDNKIFREYLNIDILENYPILSIERILDGSYLTNITFTGIKELNDDDLIGKQIVDEIVKLAKNEIVDKIDNSGDYYSRIVRSNYKHLTISSNNIGSINELLESFKYKTSFIEHIINKIDFKNIFGIEDKDLIEYISEMIGKYFNIGIGSTTVSDYENKLLYFYEAEIASKNDNTPEINNNYFNLDDIKNLSKDLFELENLIITQYNGYSVNIGNAEYDVVITFMGKTHINPLLIKYIRKGEFIENTSLYILLSEYVTKLNNGFDFIAPIAGDENLKDKSDELFKKGILDTTLIKHNHKKTLTKKYLEKYTKYNKGTKYFIDIIDMGLMNLADFRNIALKLHNGDISDSNSQYLTKSGESVTNKFILLANLIESIGGKVSLGGDEIFIFFDESYENMEFDISELLSKVGFRGRITKSDNKVSFDKLDKNSIVIKTIERKIEEIIIRENILTTYPNCIILNGDIDGDISQLIEEAINSINVKKLLTLGEDIKINENLRLRKIENQIILDVN